MAHFRLLFFVFLVAPMSSCSSQLGLNSSMQIHLAATDPALFEEINTLLFLAFPVSSPEDCGNLEDTTYGQVMETISDLEFIAVPKLHTDMPDIDHPPEVEGDYFRFVYGDLPSGSLDLLTLGTTQSLTPEEVTLGYISAESGENSTFLQRFPYDTIIARSCLSFQIVKGERIEAPVILRPYTYEVAPEETPSPEQ